MKNPIGTGYFGRASDVPPQYENRITKVHLVWNFKHKEKPVCGAKIDKSMNYLFCAANIQIDYVKCKKCLAWYEKNPPEVYYNLPKNDRRKKQRRQEDRRVA